MCVFYQIYDTISLKKDLSKMKKNSVDFVAVMALVTAMLVWASSFIAMKSAIASYGPMSVMFARMFIASLCFLYFIKSFRRLNFTKEDIKYIALMIIFEPCLYFLFESNALKYTSAAQAGMITSMMPLITAIGAAIILKESITRRLVVGAVLAVGGAIWLSLSANQNEYASNPLLGNTLEFLAMVVASGYAISIRHLIKKFSPLFLTAIQFFGGTIFFLPFGLYEFDYATFDFNLEATLWTIYLGVVVTLGGNGLFNFALGRVEASKASVYVNLIPVFAVVLSYLILGEKMTFEGAIASVIILTGVAISQFPKGTSKKAVSN